MHREVLVVEIALAADRFESSLQCRRADTGRAAVWIPKKISFNRL